MLILSLYRNLSKGLLRLEKRVKKEKTRERWAKVKAVFNGRTFFYREHVENKWEQIVFG